MLLNMSENKKKHKIVFTGGGTGGHIFPLVAIIRQLKKIIPEEEMDLYYIGPYDNLSQPYLKEKEGVKIKYISTGKIRRYGGFKPIMQNLIDIFFRIPLGIIQSFVALYGISPDLVFGKGGYGSFAVIVNARLLEVPVFLHESDSVAGAVNQSLQRLSTEVFTSFPETEKISPKKVMALGNPVREEILKGSKDEAKRIFGIQGEKPVVLIIGGSQGSEKINDLFLSSATAFLEKFEVLHQCGENNYKEVSTEAAAIIREDLRNDYKIFPFFDESQLANAYKVADIVVSRAGSGSIFEISANGKAGVFLPLSGSAQNHQVKNAYAYTSFRSGIVLEEENLSSHFFLSRIEELFSPIDQIRNMEKNALYFARPRAAHIIASYIKEYLIRDQ